MQALLVSMKIPNVLWGMAGRDKTELRSLFQQPGLFMEQNFNRIRAATQSPEIDEFFKKIPKNAVTKYSGRPSEKSSSDVLPTDRKPKTDPEKNLVNIILLDSTFSLLLWSPNLILCRIIIWANRRTKVLDLVGTIVNDIEKIETKIVARIVAKIVPVANEEMEDQKNQKVQRKIQNQLEPDRQILLDLHPRPTLKNILGDKFKLSKEKTDHQHQRKSHDHLHR